MKKYLVSYINKQGRKKQYEKSFGLSKTKDQFVHRKIKEGCRSIKVEPIRIDEYDRSIEREILLKKKRYFDSICIYALIDEDEVVYVGQSADVMSRLSTHRMSTKKFTHFSIVERISVQEMNHNTNSYIDERELYYIKALKPKYNKTGNN